MIYDKCLKGEKVLLRPLDDSDCNLTYLGWLNDAEVNKFLETRWEEQTLPKIKSFVKEINQSTHSYIFAIEYQGNHIGNIKIGPINERYKYADISYFIGNKDIWGGGIATDAIKTISKFAFEHLLLNRVQAGAFGSNLGSIRVLEKAGFKYEGCLREKIYTERFLDDHLLYGLLSKEVNF